MSELLTIEEALALMVNMDFIPDGESVLSMTAAFLEEAEVEYENASSHDASQLKVLKNRMEACAARHSLVQLLTKSLMEDAIYTEDTLIERDDDSTDKNPLVTLNSLSAWAFDRFGIAIPKKAVAVDETQNTKSNIELPNWKNDRIKIYRNYRITYSLGKDNWKHSSFLNIGLIGKRNLKPNELGKVLIKLSMREKYPIGTQTNGSEKTVISKLRRCLEKLTGLVDDAFLPFNKSDGYKPKFILIDDRRNADERAKKEAVLLNYNEFSNDCDENDEDLPESRDYDGYGTSDSELGSQFLKEHDK